MEDRNYLLVVAMEYLSRWAVAAILKQDTFEIVTDFC